MKHGQAPRSQELSHLAVLGVLGLILWTFFPTMIDALLREMVRQFTFDAATVHVPASMLARLQPKEEVLLLGWGVAMPMPVKSRRYDEKFYRELFADGPAPLTPSQAMKDLGF